MVLSLRHTSMSVKHTISPRWLPSPRPSAAALLFVNLLSILMNSNYSMAETHPADIEALQHIVATVTVSTVLPASCLSYWNFSADPCDSAASAQFFVCGLECDNGLNGKNRRLTTLALDSPGYQGTLSPFVGNLSALQVLDVSNNYFFGHIPDTVGHLTNLLELDLSGNGFSGILPFSLGQLTNLQLFIVSSNTLEGSMPTTLNNMTNLIRISVFSNKLSGSIPPLNRLGQLSFLDASANQLSGPLPSALPPSLLLLSLKNNSMNGMVLGSSIAQLSQLNVLDLSHNKFTGDIDLTIFTHPNLEQVNFSTNRFTGLNPANITGSDSHLVALDLSFNELGGSLPSYFVDMPNLSVLSLRHNHFSGEIPYEYGLKSTGGTVTNVQLLQLWLDANYVRGIVPSPFFNISAADDLVGSFVDNCLQSCPYSVALCRGGSQKSRSECDRAYSKISN